MDKINICLAGNPNVGKSSIFNILTNLKQHTGNWPGKTVDNLEGTFYHKNYKFNIVDVPGTYSLFGYSQDEIIARDYLCNNKIDCVIVVADPFSIEKSLNLLFQILKYHTNVIFVVNLIDEATKKGIIVNKLSLMFYLGIPVVFTSCLKKEGILELKDTITEVIENKFPYNIIDLEYDTNNKSYEETRNIISTKNYEKANYIKNRCVKYSKDPLSKDKKIDKILTSKIYGIPIMIILLSFILYLTITFANIPSTILFNFLFKIEDYLINIFNYLHIPIVITEFLIYGIYRTTAWVVSVMLPPMAIFFPLFSILEDLGYLPRIAYNLDYYFKKANCHGKQSLSMCMGFGCNAAGVIQTRIIDSPKSKIIAMLTNTFIPCNGRFPTFILLTTIFFTTTTSYNSLIQSLIITLFICIGVTTTLIVSKILSKYIFKEQVDTFTLELPPYRKPNILRIIQRSIIEKTIKLLLRAIKISALFGGLIYILAKLNILIHISNFLNPIALLLGLDGIILLAFILALPANEIFIPLIIMLYTNTTFITDYESINSLKDLLVENGWTISTVISVLLFSLLHFPCATTLATIKKESNIKYALLGFLIPTIVSITVCFILNLLI